MVLQNYSPPKRYIPKVAFAEDNLQRQLCQFLKLQYPHVLFRSDLDSGRNKESNFQRSRMRAMNSTRSWPDLFIYEPMMVNGVQHAGLALELKKEGTIIILKTGPRKGHLTSNPHIQEQASLLKELKKRGYFATFAIGFDDAVKVINYYFGKKEPINESMF